MTTAVAEKYNWLTRALNLFASLLMKLGSSASSLDMDDIIATARKRTGLFDLGGKEHLRFFRSIVNDFERKEVQPLGRVVIRGVLLKATINRLKIEDYIQRHPEVEDIPVKRPIFIVGFPRSGTTVLQNLLAKHPHRRGLEFWELEQPVPVYESNARLDEWLRVSRSALVLLQIKLFAHEATKMHDIRTHTLEECHHLIVNTHTALCHHFGAGLPSFAEKLFKSDIAWAYQEYKRMLQIALHKRPARQLVLKCPDHMWFLDALLQVFPDACIVWTHRDPVLATASYCSQMSLLRRLFYGVIEPREIGADVMDGFRLGVERAMKSRERLPPENFLDVSFSDIVHNKIDVLRSVDRHFGFDTWDGWESSVAAWQSSRRFDERGRHVYTAGYYGIDETSVHQNFASYISTFNIGIESTTETHSQPVGCKVYLSRVFSRWPTSFTATTVTVVSSLALYFFCASGFWPGQVLKNCFQDYLSEPICFFEQ